MRNKKEAFFSDFEKSLEKAKAKTDTIVDFFLYRNV